MTHFILTLMVKVAKDRVKEIHSLDLLLKSECVEIVSACVEFTEYYSAKNCSMRIWDQVYR